MPIWHFINNGKHVSKLVEQHAGLVEENQALIFVLLSMVDFFVHCIDNIICRPIKSSYILSLQIIILFHFHFIGDDDLDLTQGHSCTKYSWIIEINLMKTPRIINRKDWSHKDYTYQITRRTMKHQEPFKDVSIWL